LNESLLDRVSAAKTGQEVHFGSVAHHTVATLGKCSDLVEEYFFVLMRGWVSGWK